YKSLPSVPRPWLCYVPNPPDWMVGISLPVFLVVLGMMGFVTTVVVRPRTRHAAGAAGLAVGFLAAVTAYPLGLGWGRRAAKSLRTVENEVCVLSEAAVTRAGPGEPHPSDRLVAKYPDLEKLPPGERGPVLAGKLIVDIVVGLITGLWWGVFLALLLCLVPG